MVSEKTVVPVSRLVLVCNAMLSFVVLLRILTKYVFVLFIFSAAGGSLAGQ